MLFNSLDYLVFLFIILVLFWSIPHKYNRYKVVLLVLSSYFFYACWDWRFLSLIIFSSLVDYILGIKIHNAKKYKKTLLSISLICNIGLLLIFKYYNFFIDSFQELFSFAGSEVGFQTIHIILPVGISFYTFQTLSYTIDIYRGVLKPTKNPVVFFCYVSFFPQLVAGPIERAKDLLPQLEKLKKFNTHKFSDGIRQIIWGLFKKVVIADNCGYYVNDIFSNIESSSSTTLIIGAIYFSMQIYADFSGYSDIAIGTAKLFNINFSSNFKYPFFSRNISEFWRRWHISLSSWFRDYLYFPLGGNRNGIRKHILNLFIIFTVSGFWHGANFTFIAWGVLHFLYYLPELILKLNKNNIEFENSLKLKNFLKMIYTFSIVSLAFIFFRAENITQALNYIIGIFSNGIDDISSDLNFNLILLLITFMFLIEWKNRHKDHGLAIKNSKLFNYISLIATIFMIFEFGMFRSPSDFIYFNF
tara:strand:+ start:6727 stop:8145 length:1419 start_codon:yes stop_codon:yes gene_type:complete